MTPKLSKGKKKFLLSMLLLLRKSLGFQMLQTQTLTWFQHNAWQLSSMTSKTKLSQWKLSWPRSCRTYATRPSGTDSVVGAVEGA